MEIDELRNQRINQVVHKEKLRSFLKKIIWNKQIKQESVLQPEEGAQIREVCLVLFINLFYEFSPFLQTNFLWRKLFYIMFIFLWNKYQTILTTLIIIMKGPKYIETNFQLLLQRRIEYNKHLSKLKNAKCDPMLEKRSLSQQQSFLKQLEQNRKISNLKREQLKYEQIIRMNTKILMKVASVKEDQQISRNPSKVRIDSARSSKSLHSVVKRNKEKEQFQENKRLKEKIENVQSSLAYRKIIENFNHFKYEKERLVKNSQKKQKQIKDMLEALAPSSRSSGHLQENKANCKLILPKITQNTEESKSVQQLNKLRIEGFYTAR